MTRRLNKRGWHVLVSIPSDDGAHCVDIFEDVGGSFGYQHFRSDAEDLGGWTPIGSASRSHGDATVAVASAVALVPWLMEHRRAKAALEDWLSTLS